MAQQNCGASVYAVMMRLAVLEQDGVPLPGARNLYVTDALVKLTATPVYYQSPVVEIPNASGALCVNLNTRKVLKWYDLALEICNLDPEVDNMLVGGETFSSAGFVIGGSVPAAGAISAPFGVSVELWSKHIVGSDQDTVWPYIQARMFQGFTSENPNWYNGPANDWTFASDRSIAWRFTKTVPPSACGAQALASS
jgi:hypothetical protein